jgi:hypothetical protein
MTGGLSQASRRAGSPASLGLLDPAEVFGWMQPPPWPSGLCGTCREARARSPRENDDGRPLDVASGATPSGAAILREQVLVGSAGSLAVRCWWHCTEGGWSAGSRTAAGSPAARASARCVRKAS